MACFWPRRIYRSPAGSVSSVETPDSQVFSVPCGGCEGCRQARALDWSTRCRDEASLWDRSIFATLTYDEAPLTLVPRDLQLFLKRLRRGFCGEEELNGRRPIRFFACGEYGDRFGRPHYHALLFNFAGRPVARTGKETFECAAVGSCWPHGRTLVGPLQPGAAAYVAGYAAKKVGKLRWQQLGSVVDPETGEVVEPVQEFARMSLRPAIGRGWVDKFGEELLSGFAVRNGRRLPIPRYYWRILKERFPERVEWLETLRARARMSNPPESGEDSYERREARENFARLQRRFFSQEARHG